MKEGMRESSIEGVANRDVPKSCVCGRKAAIEALAGADAGRVLSHEILNSERRRRWVKRKATRFGTVSQVSKAAQRGRRPHARIEPSCTRTGRSHLSLQLRLASDDGKSTDVIRS